MRLAPKMTLLDYLDALQQEDKKVLFNYFYSNQKSNKTESVFNGDYYKNKIDELDRELLVLCANESQQMYYKIYHGIIDNLDFKANLPLVALYRAHLFNLLGLYGYALAEYFQTEKLIQARSSEVDNGNVASNYPDYKSEHALCCKNCGLSLLRLGNYSMGWKLFEQRWNISNSIWSSSVIHEIDVPIWQGEAFRGGNLLILHEQGIGDYIQFIRYAIKLKALGFNCLVQKVIPLYSLMAFNFEQHGIEIIDNEEYPYSVAFKISLLSLPLIMKATLDNIPYPEGYLNVPPQHKIKWRDNIAPLGKALKIGVVWQGSTEHELDHMRSLSFAHISKLFSLNAQFHCLQKEISAADKQSAPQFSNLFLWDEAIADFSDTSGLVNEMDLIISVDTSVAHLAGAMGKKTWILLPHCPDFRWLTNRQDSIWYQSATLFRQSLKYDWPEVIEQVYHELNRLIVGGN